MKRFLTAGALLGLLFASAVRGDDKKVERKPVKWWRLAVKENERATHTEPKVYRTAEEGKEAFILRDPRMEGGPGVPPMGGLPKEIDFGAAMAVVFAGEGESDDWDLERVDTDGKEIVIHAVREKKAASPKPFHQAILVLLAKSALPVKLEWRDGKLDEMRKERDCAGGHADKDMVGGTCKRCGKRETSSPKCVECGVCAAERQECEICQKRVPGEPPLKK